MRNENLKDRTRKFAIEIIKRVSLFFGLIVSITLIAGCGFSDSVNKPTEEIEAGKITSKKGNISIGKGIYNKYCFYCHGMEGRGDGAISIGLTPRPVDFVNDVERMQKSDEVLFETISKGIHRTYGGEALAMPQWNLILKDDEIWSVLAYIRSLSAKGRGEKTDVR